MTLVAALASASAAALVVASFLGVFPPRRAARARRPDPGRPWLMPVGGPERAGRFWAISGGVALLAFLVVYGLSGLLILAVPPAILVALLPRAYLRRRREQRVAEIRQAWPDGIRDLVGSIGAGMSLQRALEQLAVTGPAPLREVFSEFPFLARSIGVPAALRSIRERLADPTTDRVIEVLVLAHERGGSVMPEILRDLGESTTRDIWALEEIRTEALEHRINARVVFVLPWVVLVAMTVRAGPFRDFYGSPAGLMVVAIGGVMSLAGMALVARLGRDPDEPRVFGREEPA